MPNPKTNHHLYSDLINPTNGQEVENHSSNGLTSEIKLLRSLQRRLVRLINKTTNINKLISLINITNQTIRSITKTTQVSSLLKHTSGRENIIASIEQALKEVGDQLDLRKR